MRKRPLCLVAALLILILWILPKDVWLKEPDISSGEKVLITGRVTKREQKEEKQVYYLKDCRCSRTDSKFSVLAYTSKGDSYPIGCELSLYGTIYQLNQADNPGQFDAQSYYQSQGILYTFQTEAEEGFQGEWFLPERMARLREYLGERILELYEERDGGILKAVLLGDKSSLREEDQLLYQKAGISHLLAISGLHISMIGVSFYQLLRKCRLTFLEAGIPSAILLLLYGMMTGFGISTIRAVCMFLVMIFGEIFGRVYDMASAMALAALIILFQNPLQAYQAGFLLSFGAVLGICLVYPILQSVFQVKKKRWQTVWFSISIFLVTYPISIHFFYEYSLYSMLLNFIVIPCMPVIMAFGGAGMFAGCLFPQIGKLVGIPAHVTLSLYEVLCQGVLSLPSAVLRPGCEEPWQLAVYYILLVIGLLTLWYGRRRVYVLLFPVAMLVLSLRFHSGLQFTMLDVGQGDGLFLRFPSNTVCLVDGGSASVKEVGNYRILPYLKYEGVDIIDYVILTHLDEDHISGIRELLKLSGSLGGIPIGKLFFPAVGNPDENYEALWKLAEETGIPVDTIGAGDCFREEGLTMECLYPIKGSRSGDKNDSSTVLRLTYGKFTLLLTGDLGEQGERQLLRENTLQDIDVWKVSHHGSKHSGSESFLKMIRPQLGVISAGKNNRYGHPNDELLKRLETIGTQVETTIDGGALMIESDGTSFSLKTMR